MNDSGSPNSIPGKFDFRHPQEVDALNEILKNQLFRTASQLFNTLYADLNDIPELMNRSCLVTRRSNQRLYRLYRIAQERLHFVTDIPLMTDTEYRFRVETRGTEERGLIIISNTCVQRFSDAQIIAMLGHALAHFRYDHVKLFNISQALEPLLSHIPTAGVAAVAALQYLLLNWQQYALFTADRGGAIAATEAGAMIRCMADGMGNCMTNTGIHLRVQDMLTELPPVEELGLLGKIALMNSINNQAVPLGAKRINALWNWVCSGECLKRFPSLYYSNEEAFGLENETDGVKLVSWARSADQDNGKRLALMHAAAKRRNPDANNTLSYLYLTGSDSLPEDFQTALGYLKEAADLGNGNAMGNLGRIFAEGHPPLLPADPRMASHLLRAAASRGFEVTEQDRRAKGPNPERFRDQKMDLTLRTFIARFPNHTCTMNAKDPILGLTEEICGPLRLLQDRAWTPLDETVYALQWDTWSDQIVLVTECGVYVRRSTLLPHFLSLTALTDPACKVTGGTNGGMDVLLENGKLLLEVPSGGAELSVLSLLALIRDTFSK